ncbi:MAG: ABC transporter permease [Lachnospiraceae bacterium]|nr:ABC transporter permease [Lachnospiraceae bacterium]
MGSLFKDIYDYREMIFSLVRRDLRGRYKGTVLGFLWTFINPLLQLAVYTLVFSTILRMGIDKYYIFLFVALIPWIFFSGTIVGGCEVILGATNMVKKIYFPREVLPLAYTISSFVNMLFSFIVVFAVLIFTGYGLNPAALLYLPIIMIIEFVLALGMALLFSALTVYLRDLQHILGIVMMAWQFLTPIMYSEDMIPDKFMGIWRLNPMTSVITAYRDILYYKQVPHINTLLEATVLGVLLLVIGEAVFRLLQRNFAEEL